MTCSSCGNTITSKGTPKGTLCSGCTSIEPPEMNAQVYKDAYGDLWHIGTIRRDPDRTPIHYVIFRRSRKSQCDADCTLATSLTSVQQMDLKLVLVALGELAVRGKWGKIG
jgi:hypothetical protein